MKVTSKLTEAVLVEYGSYRSSQASGFNAYRELTAKRAGPADCKPGHMIKVGDHIGWNANNKKTQCSDCWRKWKDENAAADAQERGYGGW